MQVYVSRRYCDTVVVLLLIFNLFYAGLSQGLLNFRVEELKSVWLLISQTKASFTRPSWDTALATRWQIRSESQWLGCVNDAHRCKKSSLIWNSALQFAKYLICSLKMRGHRKIHIRWRTMLSELWECLKALNECEAAASVFNQQQTHWIRSALSLHTHHLVVCVFACMCVPACACVCVPV